MPGTAIVQLGRYGDIINLLPAVRRFGFWRGEPVDLIVSSEFAGLLDGVSYVKCVAVKNHVSQPGNAMRGARSGGKYREVLMAQVWRPDCQGVPPLTDSYNKDNWAHIRMLDFFFNEPLVFDQRDFNRELRLIATMERPITPGTRLASFSGHSSPFPFEKRAIDLMSAGNWVNISGLKADRIYDLLGLMECAGGAVFSDSAPLHLAAATGLPIAAFLADSPSMWHGSTPRCVCPVSVRYKHASDETFRMMTEMLDAKQQEQRFYHVFPWHTFDANAHKRHRDARNSWSPFYRSGELQAMPFFDRYASRDARLVGAADRVPFVKDIFNWACDQLRGSDVIVFTNSDVCFMSGLMRDLRASVGNFSCFYASRVDVADSSETPKPPFNLYCGADLFAFTVDWWHVNRSKFPDLLVGREGWDAVMKLLMHGSGFVPNKTWPRLAHLYHQKHDSLMHGKAIAVEPGQAHNRAVTAQWLRANGKEKLLLCPLNHPGPLVVSFE